jgi:hypothetical protein
MLSKRVQYVKHNDIFSFYYKVDVSQAQGGISSPHYFNLFVNDLSLELISLVFQYADDVLLMNIIYKLEDCDILQNGINHIFKYTVENSIKLNPKKFEHLRISLKNNIPEKLYYINGTQIETASHHKHLGIIYGIQMSFNKH